MTVHESQENPIRVLATCSSVGITNRGIESFFREAFDGLRALPNLCMRLLKGGGKDAPDERVIWSIPKTSPTAKMLGRVVGRNGYVVEQWSTFLPIIWEIRKFRPHVVFYSDANLGFLLYRFRKQIGIPFRLLFSNGGPVHPPFKRTDCVHQVAPFYYKEALDAGESPERHFMVPYGIHVPELTVCNPETKNQVRQRLGLPLNRPVVLSVGWIAREHKRMHYVIEEVCRMGQKKPFLQLLGAIDDASPEIIEMGMRLLGPENFSARSEPYEAVGDFYKAADCFVLASLQEGFGRVFLEALMYGLPVIASSHPIMLYVLGRQGTLGDLSQAGVLSGLLSQELRRPHTAEAALSRCECVRKRFSWPELAAGYHRMFVSVANYATSS